MLKIYYDGQVHRLKIVSRLNKKDNLVLPMLSYH